MKAFTKIIILVTLFFSALLGRAQNPLTQNIDWHTLSNDDSLVFSLLTINSKENDYAPILTHGNKLLFTSDRKNIEGNESVFDFNENIYSAQKSGDSLFGTRKRYFFNSDDQTAIAGISSNNGSLFLYKTFDNGDFYISNYTRGHWKSPVRMNSSINSDGHEQSVCEANGMMVISSERTGGKGGHDIYWARTNNKAKYTDFIPLNILNTAGDEMDVRLSPDGKRLWFSTNGLSDCKAFDIFVSELDSAGQWQKPVRLGAPINSDYNDRWFFDGGSMFLLSSDRSGGIGGEDIYCGYLVINPQTSKHDSLKLTVSNDPHSLERDTMFIIDGFVKGQQPKYVYSKPDSNNRYININNYIDSLGIKDYFAMVQVGAYNNLSIAEFKKNYPSLKSIAIVTEQGKTSKGNPINRFLVDQKFSSLKDAANLQQEMITKHHIKDAFVSVYDISGKRVAIYNTVTGEFVAIQGNNKPRFF
jgi:hypothetical protein